MAFELLHCAGYDRTRFRRARRYTALLTVFFLLALVNAFGQATDGNISGTIIDSSGGAVAKVQVQAENNATGVKSTTSSDGSGVYRVDNLPVGTYKVTASAPGFAQSVVEGVSVALNVNTTVNVSLSVGSVTSAVQVTEAAALIDTTTAQVTNAYTNQMATELPRRRIRRGAC